MKRLQAPPTRPWSPESDVVCVSHSTQSTPSQFLRARECKRKIKGPDTRGDGRKKVDPSQRPPSFLPQTLCAPPSSATSRSSAVGDNQIRVFAVMKNMGSLYAEMARQLLSTGKWVSVVVTQLRSGGELFLSDIRRPMKYERIAVLLGEKIPVENLIATRRQVEKRKRESSRCDGKLVPTRPSDERIVVNYVENMRCITLKGSMVSTLLSYYSQSWEKLGRHLPVTFRLIPRQPKDDEREWLLRTLRKKQNHGTLWIAKSSSGCHGDGVKIFRNDVKGVNKMLNYIDAQKKSHMWVVQVYIDRPLLYHRRKFDVRCWVLLCVDSYSIHIYEKLVMRMSSVEYDAENATAETASGRLAHITNHCVQAEGEGFGAFEEGNELWSAHLDAVIRYKGKRLLANGTMHDGANPDLDPSLRNTVLPQINHIVVETLLAARELSPDVRPPSSTQCFQVFGYDFLIDETLRVWLLEINGAPGAAERLLPRLVADTIEIALTPTFPGTTKTSIRVSGISKRNGYVKLYP